MKKVKVKCSFTVQYELEVHVYEGECPIERLSGKNLFRNHGYKSGKRDGQLYGLCESTLGELRVKVLDEDCYSDPSPTGRFYSVRGGHFLTEKYWEIEEGGEL